MKEYSMKNIYYLFALFCVVFTSMLNAQWIIQDSGVSPSPNPEIRFSFVDENVCWGIKNISSEFIRTTDGGANWNVSTIQGGQD